MALRAIGPVGQGLLDGRSSAEIVGFELHVRLRGLGSGSPQAVEKIGIIDTGASHILVDRKTIKMLGLRGHNRGFAEIASGESFPATIYRAIIEAPQLGVELVTELYAFDERGEYAQEVKPSPRVLVGRNFLRNFLVTFDGPSGIVTFARPVDYSSMPVDDE